jgi:hypothetical protein
LNTSYADGTVIVNHLVEEQSVTAPQHVVILEQHVAYQPEVHVVVAVLR